jgi:hypothetical protein
MALIWMVDVCLIKNLNFPSPSYLEKSGSSSSTIRNQTTKGKQARK